MEPRELLDLLLDLAREVGIDVRTAPAASAPGESGLAPQSGVCRVRDQVWLVLVASDSREDRIEVAVQALRHHAPDLLEGRYLPPAVRERLEGS